MVIIDGENLGQKNVMQEGNGDYLKINLILTPRTNNFSVYVILLIM